MSMKIIKNYFSKIGRKGGSAKSERKSHASRINGKKGGRPKKLQTKTCKITVCKETKIIKDQNVESGNTRSCGCYCKRVRIGNKNGQTHGQGAHKNTTLVYQSWCGMINRTTNPKSTSWKYYGDLGVKVYKHWRKFESFFKYMGNRPKGKTLDRINPFGNYVPGNVRWATRKQQANNRRISYPNGFPSSPTLRLRNL